MKEEQERTPLRTILQNFLNHVENLDRLSDDSYDKEFQVCYISFPFIANYIFLNAEAQNCCVYCLHTVTLCLYTYMRMHLINKIQFIDYEVNWFYFSLSRFYQLLLESMNQILTLNSIINNMLLWSVKIRKQESQLVRLLRLLYALCMLYYVLTLRDDDTCLLKYDMDFKNNTTEYYTLYILTCMTTHHTYVHTYLTTYYIHTYDYNIYYVNIFMHGMYIQYVYILYSILYVFIYCSMYSMYIQIKKTDPWVTCKQREISLFYLYVCTYTLVQYIYIHINMYKAYVLCS
jgi:hypothetical protein